MKDDRNYIFTKFLKENPSFADPEGHHRRLADWEYDTKHRKNVEIGKTSYEDALKASRNVALHMLPVSPQNPQTIENSYDSAIAAIAISRNQTPPPPSNYREAPPGLVAQTCARIGGLKIKED